MPSNIKRLTAEEIDRILEAERLKWVRIPPSYEFAPAFAKAIEEAVLAKNGLINKEIIYVQ